MPCLGGYYNWIDVIRVNKRLVKRPVEEEIKLMILMLLCYPF